MSAQKLKLISSLSIQVLIGAIIVSLLAAILLYNQMIKTRDLARGAVDQTEQLRLENAELKNQLYTVLDSQNLLAVADRLGLVKDADPRYMSLERDEQFIDIATALEAARSAEAALIEKTPPVKLIAVYAR
ncbi:MAG: hypothetical protein COU11_01865 [Candidatus Harrisonbacteria bacterium CG10_big_fil_rev_8_21_14_0_10_49_15]|uniref:Uncharacterized protein n=1 Tax=Candidatus Harrisonbacteria bacterium CG10_big_fil_rev_8_21_14_0_10_49_15 TaxID=1974587 RepID=A0A2H0UL63_9BACT|nr:MAG: hypothetical protein COU11_01865 [Candidatus Harrisonbacteria bacterium CG10_big_fil_rev_8_21_14_0_10_49_15]